MQLCSLHSQMHRRLQGALQSELKNWSPSVHANEKNLAFFCIAFKFLSSLYLVIQMFIYVYTSVYHFKVYRLVFVCKFMPAIVLSYRHPAMCVWRFKAPQQTNFRISVNICLNTFADGTSGRHDIAKHIVV